MTFSPSLYRNMQDECMKSCAWEQQTWVMKRKPESTVWRWRRGYLDRTGWGFINHKNGGVERVKMCTSDILSMGIHEISSCIHINVNVILSVLMSNKNPVCTLSSFVSSTLQPLTAGREITHVRHALDQLTALYCHCLLCYLFSSRNCRKIDLQSCENW